MGVIAGLLTPILILSAQDFRQLQNLPGFSAPPENLDASRWQNPSLSGMANRPQCNLPQPENFADFLQRFSKDTGFQAERLTNTFRVVTRTAPAPTKTDPGIQVNMVKKQDYELNRGLFAALLQSPKGIQTFRITHSITDAQAQTAEGFTSIYRFVIVNNCWHLAGVER